jgi:uncharacterized phiE125 gp8 family phage protein
MSDPIDSARLLTPPASEPLLLPVAKGHLRVDGDDENDQITMAVMAARAYVEGRCWIGLMTQTWVVGLDKWPTAPLRLPRIPLLTKPTISAVRYKDSAGADHTLATTVYTVLATGELALTYGQTWPVDLWPQWSIEIEYTVGYGSKPENLPAPLMAALKLLVGHFYENREAVAVGAGVSMVTVPLAVDSLLALYEVR